MRRSREVVLLAALTGVVVGYAVALFEQVVEGEMLDRILDGPWWLAAVTPGVGLAVAALALRYVAGGASPATSDEFLRAYHDPEYRLRPRQLLGRTIASISTLGSGGALGMEGPSMYGGAAIGSMIQRRLPAPFRGQDHRMLLVAGAAAGVAAIFKAPATGAIYAIEVPYRSDMVRRMLLPSLVAAASGYLAFVSVHGTEPLFRTTGDRTFGIRELFGALLVGVFCAIGARAFGKLIRFAKRTTRRHIVTRIVAMGATLAVIFVVVYWLTGDRYSVDEGRPMAVGPGYEVISWLVDRGPAIWLLIVIFLARSLATAATVAGGGAGGLFIPLVVGGALVGQGVGELVNAADTELYRFLGIAAFLGAGYRVPLAGVMFVAETTGKEGFIVPALFAAVMAELVMGEQSISDYQREQADL